jgi:hypothetical protein
MPEGTVMSNVNAQTGGTFYFAADVTARFGSDTPALGPLHSRFDRFISRVLIVICAQSVASTRIFCCKFHSIC